MTLPFLWDIETPHLTLPPHGGRVTSDGPEPGPTLTPGGTGTQLGRSLKRSRAIISRWISDVPS